jgi:acyl-CoA thioester hydrolase
VFEQTTRWLDNDVYGHINNVVYYAFFDAIVNRFLIEHGLDIHQGKEIGLVVDTGCRFFKPFAYPEPIESRLRIAHLGTSSVRYEVALFGPEPEARAMGHSVHVFVDRASRKPTPIPAPLRAALLQLEGRDG